jgi:hypothetical protein
MCFCFQPLKGKKIKYKRVKMKIDERYRITRYICTKSRQRGGYDIYISPKRRTVGDGEGVNKSGDFHNKKGPVGWSVSDLLLSVCISSLLPPPKTAQLLIHVLPNNSAREKKQYQRKANIPTGDMRRERWKRGKREMSVAMI